MSTDKTGEPLHLSAVLGDHRHVVAIKRGEITSPRFDLAFTEVKPTNRAFMPMVREQRFDICELAITTFFQAKAYGKPLILLPAAMLSRFQHALIVCNIASNIKSPEDLHGKRVGVRSYSQTTGVWIRGILANHYGVDLDRIRWVTFEDAHLAEYRDPPGVERAPSDKKLDAMLLAGEVDAAIGEFAANPQVRPLFADPAAEAQRWYERYGTVPVNHMVALKESLVRANPWLPAELYRLLVEGKRAAGLPAQDAIDMIPFGFAANRKPLDMLSDFAAQQGLILRRFTIEDLIDETTRDLKP